MTTTNRYYHAGVERKGNVVWSSHTRKSREAAAREARIMARAGGTPVIESWDRAHGLRPGFDCSDGFERLTGIDD